LTFAAKQVVADVLTTAEERLVGSPANSRAFRIIADWVDELFTQWGWSKRDDK